MKTNLGFTIQLGGPVLAGLVGLGASAAIPPVPTSASLSLERNSSGAGFITISNASDEVWALKQSSNLVDWVEVEPLKIHNGHFRRAVSGAAAHPGGKTLPRAI